MQGLPYRPRHHMHISKMARLNSISEPFPILLRLYFWGLAVLAAVYLRNQIPTKMLPSHITPHEKMMKEKPDLSMLCIFRCQCFVHQPEEIHGKGATHHLEAIFMGYIENRLSWLVCDLNRNFFFSRDMIFNESVPGHLSPPRNCPITASTDTPLLPKTDRIL